ncbi:MAG TPA: alpha/beta hydrolase [Planctomycetota bacterium]|nr:alpha/beta hydrolase [Planctomycetota bacterium]
MTATPAPGSEPVLLWPDGAPGALGDGQEDRPRLVPHLLPGGAPRSAVVVCPGGGYSMRAAHEGDPIAAWLNSLGISALVLHYRVRPYRHPVPLADAQRAIRLVRHRAADWHLDPGRVGILGFSAGGHLACSAATIFDRGRPDAPDPVDRQSSRPDLLVACYPVISFGEHRHDGSMKCLLGDPPDEELRAFLSLENRVTAETPPAFLWHTAEDQAVPVMNSLLFAGALAEHRVPFALRIFTRGRHGLGLGSAGSEAATWPAQCARWMAEAGFLPPA